MLAHTGGAPHASLFGEHSHAPAMQIAPPAQVTPQAPQLAVSVLGSTHAPAQSVRPGGQLAVQAPFEQTCTASQRTPQAPQLAGSLSVSVQATPQRV